jgi:rhodanese-related sulfurtransferase
MRANRVLTTTLLALLISPGLPAAGATEDYDAYLSSLYRGTVPLIAPVDLASLLATSPDALVLDVRSEPEREVSYIEGSVFYDFETFSPEYLASVPRDRTIVLYCAVGYRSERIGEQLIEMGFTDVRHIYGGIIEWHNAGLQLVAGEAGGSAVQTASNGPPVHGYEPRWGRYVEDGNVVYDPPVE